DALRERLEPGRRVRAPFGRGDRSAEGYCVRLANRSNLTRPLKPLTAVVDDRTLLPPAMLRLAEWMADYYMLSLGQVVEAILPAGVRSSAGTRRVTLLSLSGDASQRIAVEKLSKKQLEIVRYLAASGQPLEAKQIARAVKCTAAP